MKFIIITWHHYEYTSHTYPPPESKNYHNCTMSSNRLHLLNSSCFSNRTLGWQGWCQWPFLPLNSSVILCSHLPETVPNWTIPFWYTYCRCTKIVWFSSVLAWFSCVHTSFINQSGPVLAWFSCVVWTQYYTII